MKIVDIDMIIIRETDKAVLATTGSRDEAVWLPKAEIEIDNSPHSVTIMEISIPEWLAIEKGLI